MSSIPSHIVRSEPMDTPPRKQPRTPPSPYAPADSFEREVFEDIEAFESRANRSSIESDSWKGYSFDHLKPKPKKRKCIPDFPFSPSSSSISSTSSGSSCFSSRAGSRAGSYKEPQELQDPHSFKTKLSSELATVEQKHSAEFSASPTESRSEKATASIFSDSKKENSDNKDPSVKKAENPISNIDGKEEASDSEEDCIFRMD